jgi:hypothetical protein
MSTVLNEKICHPLRRLAVVPVLIAVSLTAGFHIGSAGARTDAAEVARLRKQVSMLRRWIERHEEELAGMDAKLAFATEPVSTNQGD